MGDESKGLRERLRYEHPVDRVALLRIECLIVISHTEAALKNTRWCESSIS